MTENIQLSDLQRLAVNYYAAVGQLKVISSTYSDMSGLANGIAHDILIESILGEEIIKKLKDPKERDFLLDQAHDFRRKMCSYDSFEINKFFMENMQELNNRNDDDDEENNEEDDEDDEEE